jgi:glutaredoxin 3
MMAVLQMREACVLGCKCLMATVEIYTTPICPYCVRAKRLLTSKGVEFIEIDLWEFPARRSEMISRAHGRRTVPQVFVDGQALGGSDDLQALESSGRLDPLLHKRAEVSSAERGGE